jgi:type II secretory pathway pseudopilin PulG
MMLSMAVIFVVLGLTATLVADYSKTMRQGSSRDLLLDAIELGAERIRSELCSAISVSQPPTISSTSSLLEFDRVDPGSTSRLPNPLPTPPPVTWDPYAPADILVVRYAISNQNLVRTVTSPTSSRDEDICPGLQGMSAEYIDPRTLRVVLNVDVEGYLTAVASEVHLWVEP